MKNNQVFKPTLLAAAVALTFPAMGAWADEVQALISPDVAEVSVKLQNINRVNSLYREYYGLNNSGINGSVDANIVKRSDEGRWFRLEARDLGLSTQELKASVEQQGDWGVKLGYDQIPHYSPLTVNTAVTGIGSNNLQLPPNLWGAGSSFADQNWKTERTATSLSANKFIFDNLQASFSYKNEDKQGTRLMTSGGNKPPGLANSFFTGQYLNPEPINSKHQQFEASLEYFSKKFQLTGSYYGSFYKNNAGNALFVNPASTTAQAYNSTNMSPLSLAPDNHSQELSLSGGYNWTDDTRGAFNVGKTFAVQDANFIAPSQIIPTIAGKPAVLTSRSNLGGKLETTNAFASLTSKVTKDLSVVASWAYEDRNDKTPKDIYLVDYTHGNGVTAYTNNPESMTTNRGKLEGTYRLAGGYRITAGYDYDEKKYKGMEEEGFREKTKEDTYRVALRKMLSEKLNGSVTFSHSDRSGSDWGSTPSIYGDHWVAPTQFADRQRDRAKFMVDWSPVEQMNLQFAYENSRDDYTSRANNMGLNKGKSDLYSVDASYQINETWKTNLWYSLSYNRIKQNERQNPRVGPTAPLSPVTNPENSDNFQTCSGSSATFTCTLWSADLDLKSEAFGAGISGRVNGRLDVGAQYQYYNDVNKYKIAVGDVVAGSQANSQVLPGAGILPDTKYTLSRLNLFGKYALAKTTSLRLDYVHDLRKMDDYTWSQFRYSDGTTVSMNPKQTTKIIAVSLTQSF